MRKAQASAKLPPGILLRVPGWSADGGQEMLHGVVVSMKKLAIEITGIPVDEYAAEIEDGDGAMGRHETNSSWSLYADRVKASACGFSRNQAWFRRVAGLQADGINSIPSRFISAIRSASSVVTVSERKPRAFHAVNPPTGTRICRTPFLRKAVATPALTKLLFDLH